MRAILLAAMLQGCIDAQPQARDPATDINFDYSIPLGEAFVRDPAAVQEDSRGEVWNAPGVRIATDFGEYGPSPDCEGRPCERLQIDGRTATLQRLRLDDGAGQLHLEVVVYEPYDLRLVVMATCQKASQCEALVPILKKTTIRILDQ